MMWRKQLTFTLQLFLVVTTLNCQQSVADNVNTFSATATIQPNETSVKYLDDFLLNDEKVFLKVDGDVNADGRSDCIVATISPKKSLYKADDKFRESSFYNRRLLILVSEKTGGVSLASKSNTLLFPVPEIENPNPPTAEVLIGIDRNRVTVKQTTYSGANVIRNVTTVLEAQGGRWFVVSNTIESTDIHSNKRPTVSVKKLNLPIENFDIEAN